MARDDDPDDEWEDADDELDEDDVEEDDEDVVGWHQRWPQFAPSRPLDVEGGLRTKSRRGDIGETWWSRRFISLLESFRLGARLARGKSYARRGQVMTLDIGPGEVSSRVQGSRQRPYDVRLRVAVIQEADWARAEDAMATRALFCARLLAGEMPNDIEQAFAACRLSLFPVRPKDLSTSCSCPDWSNPCKHVAAALYVLAESFDSDPFRIFLWRGRSREALLDNLRARRGAGVPAAPEAPTAATSPVSTAEVLESFWKAPAELAELRVRPRAAATPDAILRELAPPAIDVRGKPLADVLAAAYGTMVSAAEKRALG